MLGLCLLTVLLQIFGTHGHGYVVPPSDCVYNGQIMKEGTFKSFECDTWSCFKGEVELCSGRRRGCNVENPGCRQVTPTGECVFREKIYADGSSFITDDCFECRCNEGYLNCIGTGNVITEYDEDLCKIVKVDKCTEWAVLKSDETKACPHYGGMLD